MNKRIIEEVTGWIMTAGLLIVIVLTNIVVIHV